MIMTHRTFIFLWVGKGGPVIRTFDDVHAFSGYVREVRNLCGWKTVEFRTPTLCIGCVP